MISIAKTLGWVMVAGCVLVVAILYSSLPNELPLNRFDVIEKSWFTALRIPIINICIFSLILIFFKAINRQTTTKKLELSFLTLLLVSSTKAVLETYELVVWPEAHSVIVPILAVLVVGGILLALFFAREFISKGEWRKLLLTKREKITTALLVSLVVICDLPLIFN